ncbi:MAG TPA: hypothetical protein VFZ67_00210 [Nitrososphaera sp.]
MGKEIRIIKKNGSKISDGYTFIDDRLVDLTKIASNENDSNVSSSSDDKKYREYAFKLRNNPKKKDMKARGRSRLVGGHSTQSHSSVYE